MSAILLVVFTMGPALLGAVVALGLDAADRTRAGVGWAVTGLTVSGAVSLWAGFVVASDTAFGVLRVGSAFSTVSGLILLLAALALIGGWSEFTSRQGGGSSAALVAFAAVGAGAVVQSSDLLMLLVALETVTAAGYALVAEARTPNADESSMKYFIQGAISTGLFVMGLAVLVGGFAPTGSYAALLEVLSTPVASGAAVAGVLLILTALSFKASIAPFHSWAPDAYQSARPEVAAFLSAGPKLGAVGALAVLVIYVTSGSLHDQIIVPLAALAGLSVLVGSLGALRQTSYTRMLGYAGVAQVGYALIGVVTLSPTSAVFYASTYAIATTGTFLAATAFRQARPQWDGTIAGLSGMGRRLRVVSACVAVLLVSLAGIPPLLGFWGKFQVFAGAITTSGRYFMVEGRPGLGWVFALLTVVGLSGAVISLAYYGGVLRVLYSDDGESRSAADGEETATDGEAGSSRAAMTTTLVVVGLALVVVVLGLIPLFAGVTSILLPFTVR